MSTGQVLFQDILEHPDDSGLRRIYADWLEDHGQTARAELIRVQCDLAEMDDDAPGRFDLEQRERELLDRHHDDWLGPVSLARRHCRFERGFLDQVDLDAGSFLRHGEALFAHAPIRRLAFTDLRSSLQTQQVIDSPLLDRVERLDLDHSGIGTWDLIKLFQVRPLSRLRSLSLNGVPVGHAGLQAVLRHPVSLRLRELELCRTGIGGNGVEELCSSPNLGELEALRLDDNDLGANGTSFLCGARHLTALKRLSLSGNRIPERGARDIARSPHLRNLVELDLSFNPLGFDGGLELARSPHLTQLRLLDLSYAQLPTGLIRPLAESPLFDSLTHLRLGNNNLQAAGVEALVRGRMTMPSLVSLHLGGNEIGDEGAKVLATWPALSRLRHLLLRTNGLRAFGLRPLLFSNHLGRLTTLDLRGNRLGDMGAQVLARWPGLATVQELNVGQCGIGDLGAAELLAAIPRMRWLSVTSNDLSPGVLQQYQQARDEGRIQHLVG